MDFSQALTLIDNIVTTKMGRALRNPEISILEGAWNGLTYGQIADGSEYSTNYLMRDVAPKLWKLLSDALETPIGKTNFQVTLTKLIDDQPGGEHSPPVKQQSNQDTLLFEARSKTDGYAEELAVLEQSFRDNRCRLLSIYGLTGVGKTTLVRQLLAHVAEQFDQVIWQHHIPPFQELLNIFEAETPATAEAFLKILQLKSCLIVLDAAESILEPGHLAGQYRSGYEPYGQLFRQLADLPHQSCVILLGLENPPEILRLSHQNSAVSLLHLKGLSSEAGSALLAVENLTDQDSWNDLIHLYQGNPAALKIVSQTIRKLFNGSVDAFLAQQSFMFTDINALLDKSFVRISQIERDILFWLASKDTAVPLETLQEEIPLVVNSTEMLEALESLIQRSLLETTQTAAGFLFCLQPIIKEYIAHKFIAQVCGSSTEKRYPSPQLLGPVIDLSGSAPQEVHLSHWFQHRFEPGWQPVERLFEDSRQPLLRLRSAYHLRDETFIKRFKSIYLQGTSEPSTVALLVAISQMADQSYQICVQVQPLKQATSLVTGLRLQLLDAQSSTLAKIVSQAKDSFIQLPYFRGRVGEKFGLQLELPQATHVEQFVI